ncbi:Short chain aldehyde dehydrogenase 1-like protein [Drosera capensis]
MSTVSVNLSAKRLAGKVAVITGGASGIGACTAKLFIQHGARVIVADIQDDLGQSLCKDIGGEGISYINCNVTDEASVANLVDTVMSKYERLDIMYSNAGIAPRDLRNEIIATEGDDFKRVLDVNLYGGFLCSKHAARVMIPANKGVILFTASLTSVTSGLAPHAYTVSKVATVGLARNLCVDLGKSPTYISTPLVLNAMKIGKSLVDEAVVSSNVLKGCMVMEEDVANTALFLASDESKAISGENIVVDGGYNTTNCAFNTKVEELISSSSS